VPDIGKTDCQFPLRTGETCSALISQDGFDKVGLDVCHHGGQTTFVCGQMQGQPLYPASAHLLCQVCFLSDFVDTEDEHGFITGTLTWGQNQLGGAVDESMLDGYEVWLADNCGIQLQLIGSVEKANASDDAKSSACCNDGAYSMSLVRYAVPEAATSFMVTPFQGNSSLLGGLQVPMIERTTTTTTTTITTTTTTTASNTTTSTQTVTSSTYSHTSVTRTSSTSSSTSSTSTTTCCSTLSVVIRGCLGLSVSNTDYVTGNPEASAALKEVVRQVVSDAAGPEVKSEYVKDVLLQKGNCGTGARRLARRLDQDAMSADYVLILEPTAENDILGGTELVGQRARQNLADATLDEVASFMRAALQSHSVLASVDVSVTAVSAVLLDETSKPYLYTFAFTAASESDADKKAQNGGWMLGPSIAVIVLAVLACTLSLSWRFRHALNVKPPQPPEPESVVRVVIKDPEPEQMPRIRFSARETEKPRNPSERSSGRRRSSWGDISRHITPDGLASPSRLSVTREAARPAGTETAFPWPHLSRSDHGETESREDQPSLGQAKIMHGCCGV